jgi:hypothetical protein
MILCLSEKPHKRPRGPSIKQIAGPDNMFIIRRKLLQKGTRIIVAMVMD